MAGKTLEEYFVSLGIKGQNVVLKNIDNIKKKANELTKPKTVNVKAKAGSSRGSGGLSKADSDELKYLKQKKKDGTLTGNEAAKLQEYQEQKKENKKLVEGINKFASGTKNFAVGVAHFDPTAAVQQAISSTGSAMGAIAKAIPVIGDYIQNLPKGIADITNAFVGMGTGALQMAKDAAAGQYGLSNRNEMMKWYGGEGIGQGGMSRAQHSELIMTIAGSFGKIQKPLQETVNKLVESKNTEALSRVAGGNWASTGEDRGWFLQQISNETAGLPPSIAQAIQNSLLKSNADLIKDKGAEAGAQRLNATFQNQAEEQTAALFGKLDEKTMSSLTSLNSSINKMQASMFDAGLGMATQIDKAANKISDLVKTFDSLKKAVEGGVTIMGRHFDSPQVLRSMIDK